MRGIRFHVVADSSHKIYKMYDQVRDITQILKDKGFDILTQVIKSYCDKNGIIDQWRFEISIYKPPMIQVSKKEWGEIMLEINKIYPPKYKIL